MDSSKKTFAVSSRLIHIEATVDHKSYPILFWIIETRRYERTSFSLLKDLSQLAIDTAIVSIICKAIRRMSGGLQDALMLSCTIKILRSRIFSYNCLPSTSELYKIPKLLQVYFSCSQPGPFHVSSVASHNFGEVNKYFEFEMSNSIWLGTPHLETQNVEIC